MNDSAPWSYLVGNYLLMHYTSDYSITVFETYLKVLTFYYTKLTHILT